MVNTYDDYIKNENSLKLNEFLEIHNEIASEIGNDADGLELYGNFVEKAIQYAAYRAKWLQMDRSEKMDMDESRTLCHDSVIVRLNMISRYLQNEGKSIAWREKLGYTEVDSTRRKTIGDFACFVVFINSLNAR